MTDEMTRVLPAIARAIAADPEIMVTLCQLIPQESQEAVVGALLPWFATASIGPTGISLVQYIDASRCGVMCVYTPVAVDCDDAAADCDDLPF
jgi:hypothetical protein